MHVEVTLQRDNLTHSKKVKGRNLSPSDSIIGTHNANPRLNTLACDVTFEHGDVRECMANTIGENMLARTDADGHVTVALQAIINHRKDETACELKDKHAYANNKKKLKNSAQG